MGGERANKLSRSIFLFILGLGQATPGYAVERITPVLTSSLGASLFSNEPKASVLFEPELILDVTPFNQLVFYGGIERPLDPYANFAVPKVRLSDYQAVDLFPDFTQRLIFAASGLGVHRWATDGVALRASATIELSKEMVRNVQFVFTGGLFGQYAEFRQTASGRAIPRYGFSQSIGAIFSNRGAILEARLSLEQRYGATWSNDYATYEAASYRFSESFALGISHELLSSLVDDATGLYRPFGTALSRDSRFSTFATWTL